MGYQGCCEAVRSAILATAWLLVSSEHAVTSWIFSKSYLITNQTAQLFRQHFKRFSNDCQLPSQCLNWVFKVSASCSNTKLNSLSKSQGCLISELLWQIIPYHSKAVFSSAMLVSFGIFSVPVSHPSMIIQWIGIWRFKYQRGYF